MKLFYHFLFFVCASLILVACANLFASDPQSQAQSQTDEFTSPETNGKSTADDTTVAISQVNPFLLTSLKQIADLQPGSVFEFERNCVYKKTGYLHQFQMAMNQLQSPKKFK
jgi:hypothetical protein